jgi:hypothetical protein
MSVITSSKARIAALGAAALATGSIGTLLLSGSAEAIPTPQRSCATQAAVLHPLDGWEAVNSAVTIDNGRVARKVVVNFNADAYVVGDNRIKIGYRIGKASMRTVGAQDFATHTEFSQMRHSMVVLDVPAGKHRIQPYWRVVGPVSSHYGVLAGRCLTAEAYTN